MKTRNLILLSIGCGLMILLAGGFKLFQVATDRTEVPVNKLGVAAMIGDMTTKVTRIEESAGKVVFFRSENRVAICTASENNFLFIEIFIKFL